MGLLIPSRRRGPRRFSYEPRFYDPTKEEDLKNRMRIKSKVRTHRRRRAGGLLYLVAMLLLTIYIINLVAGG